MEQQRRLAAALGAAEQQAAGVGAVREGRHRCQLVCQAAVHRSIAQEVGNVHGGGCLMLGGVLDGQACRKQRGGRGWEGRQRGS